MDANPSRSNAVRSTRVYMGGRSLEPTIADTFTPFAAAAFTNMNISAYYDETSDVRQSINAIAQSTKAEMSNQAYSMLGEENRNMVRRKENGRVMKKFVRHFLNMI